MPAHQGTLRPGEDEVEDDRQQRRQEPPDEYLLGIFLVDADEDDRPKPSAIDEGGDRRDADDGDQCNARARDDQRQRQRQFDAEQPRIPVTTFRSRISRQ